MGESLARWVSQNLISLTLCGPQHTRPCDNFVQVSGKSESVELKDCPLELKEIEAPECPRYTGVLKRGDTEVMINEEKVRKCNLFHPGQFG